MNLAGINFSDFEITYSQKCSNEFTIDEYGLFAKITKLNTHKQ